jgi:hypothetical protein
MILTELHEPFPEMPQPPRSAGLHVSDIIKSIMTDLWKNEDTVDDTTRARWTLGYVWESALELAYKERLGIRPAEIVVDGISCSPDYILREGGATIVNEAKCTWGSSNKDPSQNLRWMLQTKAYCMAAEATHVKMYVFYMCGNWKPPAPEFKLWDIQYSEQEVVDARSYLLAHAKSKGML